MSTPVHEQIRAMRGRGAGEAITSLARGDVVRCDGVKYAVTATPRVSLDTGSVVVHVYSEDNQHDHLYMNRTATMRVIGRVDLP